MVVVFVVLVLVVVVVLLLVLVLSLFLFLFLLFVVVAFVVPFCRSPLTIANADFVLTICIYLLVVRLAFGHAILMVFHILICQTSRHP